MAIIITFAIANGQNKLSINLVGSPSVTVPFNEIQKITFDADHLLLKTTSGLNSYPFDNIASITFLEEIRIKEIKEVLDVNVYVNSYGEIVVDSPLKINQLAVFDLIGKEVAISSQNKMNVNALSAGLYILQVATEQGLVSKKFVKN